MCIQFSKISNQLINKSQHIRLIVFNQCHTRQLCCRIRNAFIFAFKICCFFRPSSFCCGKLNHIASCSGILCADSLILQTLHYSLIVSVYVSIVFAVSTFLLFICSLGRPIHSRFSSRWKLKIIVSQNRIYESCYHLTNVFLVYVTTTTTIFTATAGASIVAADSTFVSTSWKNHPRKKKIINDFI